MNKAEYRNLIAERKKSLSEKEKEQKSFRLFQNIEQSLIFKKSRTILLYHSLPDEVTTHTAVEHWSKKKLILLPAVKGDDLELRQYTSIADLKEGAYHILEPAGKLFDDFENIELAIVPGVAFDRQGNRLGRGKGYYDRLLPHLKNAYKIGICYECQLIDVAPHEPFDHPMDAVCTECGWAFSTEK